MRILQVHNYYREPGGERRMFEQEKDVLITNGHDVYRYTKNNEDIKGIVDKVQIGLTAHYSTSSYNEFNEVLERVQPDLVHVHNFFPLITPSIFDAMLEKQLPSVISLHNYRLIHPNAKMTAKGQVDERSVQGSAYRCVWDRVYRNSLLQTAAAARMIEFHRKRGTWQERVTRFIALNEFCRGKFVEAGLPADKIMIKSNFIPDPWGNTSLHGDRDDYFIYVGRISEEKGIKTLIRAWKDSMQDLPLYLVGEGPLKIELERKTSSDHNIKWLGYLEKEYVLEHVKNAKALLFPSECYETYPLVILEAFASATPVVSSNVGSQQLMVDHEKNGLLYEMGDTHDLARKVRKLNTDSSLVKQLGENARRTYERHYTPEKNYRQLMNIYQAAIREDQR